MSKDIRSFFSKAASKTKVEVSASSKSKDVGVKKKRVLDSDDDEKDVHVKSPKKTKKSNELQSVNVSEIFSSKPVAEGKTQAKIAKKEPSQSPKSPLASSSKENKNSSEKKETKKPKREEPSSNNQPSSNSPADSKKRPQNQDLTDEERYERKRAAAALYQKFKNRSGPSNPGSKEIPRGKPNCLSNMTFLISGTLESMEREEAAEVIEKHGGKVVKSISKKLSYLVVGEDAGPAKLAKAEELNITQLSEDELLDLIRERSGIKTTTKSSQKFKSPESQVKPDKKPSPRKMSKTPLNEESPRPPLKIESPKPSLQKASSNVNGSKTKSEVQVKNDPVKSEDTASLGWVDKYKPTSIKQVIGQQGPASNCSKLLNWLSKWQVNRTKKLSKPNPWAKNDDGAAFKAALLSGPPGVGKTTCATLVCKELGFDYVEFNASDTRSKKVLENEVATLLSNQSLSGFLGQDQSKSSKTRVLIMDEVDGMAGNEDRGGIAELISFIKNTKVPILCLCNDRNHQKIRSLSQHCFDLRFNKPKTEQIRGAMMSICFKEKMKLSPATVDEIIAGTGNDVRQTLNHLAMYSASRDPTKNSVDEAKKSAKSSQKDVKIGPWDVIKKVFSYEDHKTMSVNEKASLFFHDYSLGPLFVQENYLGVAPQAPAKSHMKLFALAADSLSLGDMVDRRIRSNNAWSLLPAQAIFSSVMPGHFLEGNFTKQINFPSWLGKNSRTSKRKRLAQEINDHTRSSTLGSRSSIRLDYAPYLIKSITHPLKTDPTDGVRSALEIIKNYRLLREDIDSLLELTTWPKQKSLMDGVDSKVKAALTRLYNKEVQPYSYSAMATVKKRKAEAIDENGDLGDGEYGGEESEEDEKEDSIENNPLIKIKKKISDKSSEASSSKGSAKSKAAKTSKKSKK